MSGSVPACRAAARFHGGDKPSLGLPAPRRPPRRSELAIDGERHYDTMGYDRVLSRTKYRIDRPGLPTSGSRLRSGLGNRIENAGTRAPGSRRRDRHWPRALACARWDQSKSEVCSGYRQQWISIVQSVAFFSTTCSARHRDGTQL
jgi:hypothetical protein